MTDIFTSSFFNSDNLLSMLLSIPGIILAFSAKGFFQALIAKKLGDDTPQLDGKLTLNPMAHIDLIGFLFILLCGIGWGKPVRTNSRNYKNIKRDTAIQILSGPIGLIVTAFVLSLFSILFFAFNIRSGNDIIEYLFYIFYFATSISLTLAIFYLIPLPGLDGYNLIVNFLPYSAYRKVYIIEKYSMFIFIGFILLLDFTNLGHYLFWPATKLMEGFFELWSLIFTPIFDIELSFLLHILRFI